MHLTNCLGNDWFAPKFEGRASSANLSYILMSCPTAGHAMQEPSCLHASRSPCRNFLSHQKDFLSSSQPHKLRRSAVHVAYTKVSTPLQWFLYFHIFNIISAPRAILQELKRSIQVEQSFLVISRGTDVHLIKLWSHHD